MNPRTRIFIALPAIEGQRTWVDAEDIVAVQELPDDGTPMAGSVVYLARCDMPAHTTADGTAVMALMHEAYEQVTSHER